MASTPEALMIVFVKNNLPIYAYDELLDKLNIYFLDPSCLRQ